MKIACVGPFCDSNFGDYAMLVNDIYWLGRHEYTVFTLNELLLQELSDTYLSGDMVKCCPVRPNYHYEPPASDHYQVEYDTTADTPAQILSQIENIDQLRNALEPCEIVAVIGGGYFNHAWNAKHRRAKLLSILAPLLLADAMKKKIFFLGNTYGPFDESREMFADFFHSLSDVRFATRDDVYSITNLRRLGITSPITLLPDDLYFLSPRFPAHGSIVRQPLPKDYLILELYASISELTEKMPLLRNFVLKLRRRYHMEVVLLPLDRRFGGEYQAKLLAREIPQAVHLCFGEQSYRRVEDVREVIRNAKILLCQRYHLFVFAIANNIPAVEILKDVCGDKRYYYSKAKGLLRQVFQSQEADESLFLVSEIEEGISLLLNDMNRICQGQHALFNVKKCEDESEMRRRRELYLKEILTPH